MADLPVSLLLPAARLGLWACVVPGSGRRNVRHIASYEFRGESFGSAW